MLPVDFLPCVGVFSPGNDPSGTSHPAMPWELVLSRCEMPVISRVEAVTMEVPRSYGYPKNCQFLVLKAKGFKGYPHFIGNIHVIMYIYIWL